MPRYVPPCEALGEYRIVARPFGYAMYASPAGIGWSDIAAEAHVYDWRDNPDTKLTYWRAILAASGIDASTVTVEHLGQV